MARQKGIIKLQGSIGDVSFYKSQDGHLAREKGGVDAERIATDPAFARTRENGAEFGSSASAGKLLRDALRTMMLNAADNRVVSRLTKVMTDIKNLDTTSLRGERRVGIAMTDQNTRQQLKGFNFNIRAAIGSVLFKPYFFVPASGLIKFTNLTPANDIKYPSGATHVSFTSAFAKIDFGHGTHEVQYSPVVNLPINNVASTVTLLPAAAPIGGGSDLFLLKIEFFQELNGVQYPLKNGAYNVLAIVEVV